MKYRGRWTAFFLVLVTNFLYMAYYYIRDGYLGTFEFLGFPVMLTLAWFCGKQYDKVKYLEEKNQRQKQELLHNQKLFQAIFEKAPVGVVLYDRNGRLYMSNPKMEDILGYTNEELLSKTIFDFTYHEDLPRNKKKLKNLLDGEIKSYELEKRYIHKNGQVVWGRVRSSIMPVVKGNFPLVLATVSDITEQKRNEQQILDLYQQLKYISARDGLTGIANRRYFDEFLDEAFSKCKQNYKPISLIMLDIDFFKEFNDQYGHLKGDECLKQVASVLDKNFDSNKYLVARYGGEEFSIVLPETCAEEAIEFAEEIREKINELQIPHIGSVIDPYITASLGVSSFIPVEDTTIRDLILLADEALYRAKQFGRNCVGNNVNILTH